MKYHILLRLKAVAFNYIENRKEVKNVTPLLFNLLIIEYIGWDSESRLVQDIYGRLMLWF